jgi:hypothetical protein
VQVRQACRAASLTHDAGTVTDTSAAPDCLRGGGPLTMNTGWVWNFMYSNTYASSLYGLRS